MPPGCAIAAALGLDVDRLRKFTITAEAGSLPIVEAEYILDELDESGENLLTELRRYELTEVT